MAPVPAIAMRDTKRPGNRAEPMIRLDKKQDAAPALIHTTVTLDFDARQKSRQRVVLDDGREAGIQLARGSVLVDGDVLTDAERSVCVRVAAAAEALSYVHCHDRLLLNRICYHLGNRHVPLQVTCEAVAYRRDHVLDAMVAGLGVTPRACCCAFQPEPGAYEGHAHAAGGHHHGHAEHAALDDMPRQAHG